ncbi:FHAD1 protein, partial [Struthidea cinerea]|nr:FHAD1 protein [Struthidea cinerea]
QSAGVAERHAALEFSASDNSFILQDFNSPHGTFVNSCQVQNAAVRVRPGDILSFGPAGASLELVVDGAAQVGWGCPGKGVGMSRERCPGRVGWVLLPRERCPGKDGCCGPWQDARARVDEDVQGKVPWKRAWVLLPREGSRSRNSL